MLRNDIALTWARNDLERMEQPKNGTERTGMCITYLVFGSSVANYTQARFSLLSFSAQLGPNDRILVLTDHPQHFTGLGSLVELLPVSAAELEDWKGPHHFFWRIKIKAFERVSSAYPNHHLLYLDADTFLFGHLNALRQTLDQGNHLMHLNEGLLCELPTKTERTMWAQVNGRQFAGQTIRPQDAMWNAGLVGISSHNSNAITRALTLCDALCEAEIIPRLIEQFALSLALNSPKPLQTADHHVGHYWGNKAQWLRAIESLFEEHSLQGQSLEELTQRVSSFPYESLPVYLKTSNSKVALVRWLKSKFSSPTTAYIRSSR